MNTLTITIEDNGGQAGGEVRYVAEPAPPEALIRAAVVAGRALWRKGGRPWQPLCPVIAKQLPPSLRFSELFLAACIEQEDAGSQDHALLKARLMGVCAQLGLSADQLKLPVAQLSPRDYHAQAAVLAILSPNPDIVILPSATWLSVEEWRRLCHEFAGRSKTLWFVAPASGGSPAEDRDEGQGGQGGSFSLRCQLVPALSLQAQPPSQPVARPKAQSLAQSLVQPPREEAGAEQSQGIALTTVRGLSEAQREAIMAASAEQAGDILGSPERELVLVTGSAAAETAMSYDLSAFLQSRGRGWDDCHGDWLVAVVAKESVQLVWGCLSRRRRPLPVGGTIVLAAGAQVSWQQMTTQPPGKAWQWLLGPETKLELVKVMPHGEPDTVHKAETAEVGGICLEYDKTYHNQSEVVREAQTEAESQPWRQLRLWRAAGAVPSWATMGRAEEALGQGVGENLWRGLPRGPHGANHWRVEPILAVLASHQIPDPWAYLLALAWPEVKAKLPIEYYVDLISLTEP